MLQIRILTLARSIPMADRGWKTSTLETPQFWTSPPPGKTVDLLTVENIESNNVESVHLLLLGGVHLGQAHWWVCLHHDDDECDYVDG